MKLIYILSLGHSGSTLTDCILGTHPDFFSSGELRYLNWQLERTTDIKATTSAQNCCTCEQNFRDCTFWSKVFKTLKHKTGKDIVAKPTSFDTAFFGKFSYQNRDGFNQKFSDKVKGYLFRQWLERGYKLSSISWLEPRVNTWVQNNWLLYETIAEVADKPIVVDSSKDLCIALLMQQYKPQDVYILFLHRSIEGLVASAKKWSEKKGKPFDMSIPIQQKQTFEKRVKKYKKIKSLKYIDVEYENIVQRPADLIEDVVRITGANQNYQKQLNNQFYINPFKLHLVGGNPMRYKRKQLVRYDASWKKRLSEKDLQIIENSYYS